MTSEAIFQSAKSLETSEESAIYTKITWKLIPFLFVCYTAAYLDRVNIGFAKVQMMSDLKFSDMVYGLGAGLFFLGYVIFEVPSNLYMARVGARRTLMRIMILWGITSAAMAFVTTPTMFYVLRFLLGVFEAGFAPGVILYLSTWFPGYRRARVMALFLIAVPFSGVMGAPLSGWIISHFHGVHDFAGWQWMLIIEGIPPVILGALVYFVLSDKPSDAKWLNDREKAVLQACLIADPDRGSHQHGSFKVALKDPRIYILAFIYFAISTGIFLVAFWLPTLLGELGKFDAQTLGLLTAIPWTAALVSMLAVALHSDKTGERRWHIGLAGLIGLCALVATTAVTNIAISIVLFSIAAAGILSMMPVFWALPTQILTGAAAAGGIALINSIGTLSGFVSPYVVGAIRTSTGSSTIAVLVVGIVLLLGVIVTIVAVPKLTRSNAVARARA